MFDQCLLYCRKLARKLADQSVTRIRYYRGRTLHGRNLTSITRQNTMNTYILKCCMHMYIIEAADSAASSTQLSFPVEASQSDPGPLKQDSLESKQKESASAGEPLVESTVSSSLHAWQAMIYILTRRIRYALPLYYNYVYNM